MTLAPDEFPPFGPGRHLLSVQQLDAGLLDLPQ